VELSYGNDREAQAPPDTKTEEFERCSGFKAIRFEQVAGD